MQHSTNKAAAIALIALGVSACASGPTVPDLSMTSEWDYVATRAFQVRTSPSINAKTLADFREGDVFSGRAAPAGEEPWTYLLLRNGPEGYVFGRPFISDYAAR